MKRCVDTVGWCNYVFMKVNRALLPIFSCCLVLAMAYIETEHIWAVTSGVGDQSQSLV